MSATKLDGPSVNGTGGEGAADEPLRTTPTHLFQARQRLSAAKGLIRRDDASDEAVNRALDAIADAQGLLTVELAERDAKRSAEQRRQIALDGINVTDSLGRRRSPAALPGFNKGRTPRNKGQKFPATPPTTEEMAALLRTCDRSTPAGLRFFSWALLTWRTGLRISESLDLTEADLDPDASTVYVRCGKGGKSRLVGTDDWLWKDLQPWLEYRRTLPVGTLFCVITGPTAGRRWSTSAIRRLLPQVAQEAGIRHRMAPHQLRHAHALGLLQEEINPAFISRQLGHENLAITTTYFQALPQNDVINAVRSRPVPQVNAMATVEQPALPPAPLVEVARA